MVVHLIELVIINYCYNNHSHNYFYTKAGNTMWCGHKPKKRNQIFNVPHTIVFQNRHYTEAKSVAIWRI